MFGLYRQLRQIRRAATPARQFRAALWSRLSPLIISSLNHSLTPSLRLFPVYLFALFISLTLSTSVYAYESPGVGAGHPLFGVKRSLERLEGKWANTPERRAYLQAKLNQRRLAEIRLQVKELRQQLRDSSLNAEAKQQIIRQEIHSLINEE